MEAHSTDGDLLLRSFRQPEVFGELFERHFDDVRAYFARRVGLDGASDLAAEVFRIAFERRRSFDLTRSASCRPWLFGIARNVLAKSFERDRRAAALSARLRIEESPCSHVDETLGELDALDAAVRLRTVLAALVRLDDETRELLLLIAWDSLSYEEAAAALGVPIGTVRSRLSRARLQLTRLVALDDITHKDCCYD
jgi:RNA polymerase sigma-70 factor (ECF subfamily)